MLDFDGRTFQVLEMALDGGVTTQKSIAHNLSNINTPGYNRLEVSFKDQLSQIILNKYEKLPLKITSEKHISNTAQRFAPKVTQDKTGIRTPDGNNVDIDREMVDMVKNNLYFNTVSSVTNKKISLLKYVEAEGRR
ncbi:MAG: flagellar basal body rod protein FlgB [Syntrophomonadaceae bacterium]|jgi:flagellar basal-body rod protein FlgB